MCVSVFPTQLSLEMTGENLISAFLKKGFDVFDKIKMSTLFFFVFCFFIVFFY